MPWKCNSSQHYHSPVHISIQDDHSVGQIQVDLVVYLDLIVYVHDEGVVEYIGPVLGGRHPTEALVEVVHVTRCVYQVLDVEGEDHQGSNT